jgi:hypothetical protein
MDSRQYKEAAIKGINKVNFGIPVLVLPFVHTNGRIPTLLSIVRPIRDDPSGEPNTQPQPVRQSLLEEKTGETSLSETTDDRYCG